MCGILGQYQYNSQNLNKLLALSHDRGPDQSKIWEGEGISLGFNRLAILDLSPAGHQPMHSPSTRYSIVFNGEIYNHQKLRAELPPYPFRGHSDTETISYALDEWGIQKTVESLDGMFALAIYDHQTQKLSLARDFAGIKPLFFGQKGPSIVFASQYDQIRMHPLFRDAPIDASVLKLYLQQHFVPAPFGLFQGTEQVRPGEIIQFNPQGDRQYIRYWEIPEKSVPSIFDQQTAERLISDSLSDCVEDQLLSDVPLGTFLSGGVDSPLITYFAKQYRSELEVFSIGSDSKVHDESERAKAFAQAIEVNQNLWKLDAKESLDYWEEATQALHEPLADFSILPTYLVSKLARKKVTVALSGDGGDELFFGYERFWSLGKNIAYQHWPKLAKMGLYAGEKYLRKSGNINSLVLVEQQAKAHESLHSRFPKAWLNRIFPDLQNVSLPEEWRVYDYPNTKDIRELLYAMRKAEFYGMMQKTLRKVDLASMENSLEVRVPFLQKKFIEQSLKIDPLLNYGPNQKKQLLKKILAKALPQIEDDNVKRGFSVPLGKWIQHDLKDIFYSKLTNPSNAGHFGMNIQEIENMLNQHTLGQGKYKWPLFTLYALVSQ